MGYLHGAPHTLPRAKATLAGPDNNVLKQRQGIHTVAFIFPAVRLCPRAALTRLSAWEGLRGSEQVAPSLSEFPVVPFPRLATKEGPHVSEDLY